MVVDWIIIVIDGPILPSYPFLPSRVWDVEHSKVKHTLSCHYGSIKAMSQSRTRPGEQPMGRFQLISCSTLWLNEDWFHTSIPPFYICFYRGGDYWCKGRFSTTMGPPYWSQGPDMWYRRLLHLHTISTGRTWSIQEEKSYTWCWETHSQICQRSGDFGPLCADWW